jgi:hypothetical protein
MTIKSTSLIEFFRPLNNRAPEVRAFAGTLFVSRWLSTGFIGNLGHNLGERPEPQLEQRKKEK